MDAQQRDFLNLATPPARLTTEQVAWLLGFQPHDIPVLARQGLIRALGKPAHNAPKYYAYADLQEKLRDAKWLGKASEAIQSHWQRGNARRHNGD